VPKAVASAAPPVTNSMVDRLHGKESTAPPVSAPPQSEMAPNFTAAPPSVQKRSWGVSRWVMVACLFIALGVALARWRGLERFFLH
jgi:hypothetical protein